jgi:hypothetical protein
MLLRNTRANILHAEYILYGNERVKILCGHANGLRLHEKYPFKLALWLLQVKGNTKKLP